MKTSSRFLVGISVLLLGLLAACGPGLEGGPGRDPVTESMSLDGMGSDPCLQGNWEMSNSDVNALMASLVPITGLTIPTGTLQMSFTGDDFSYGSQDLVLHADVTGGYMEAEAVFLFTATFATEDGMIIFTDTVYDVQGLVWRAAINGGMEEIPGPQALLFPVPGGGPYECSSDMLVIDAVGGTGDTVYLIFFRQP